MQLKEIARCIEQDQAISTKVLRTVNSSFYGLPRRCGNIQQAIGFLGLETVKGLVLGFSLVKSIDGGGSADVTFDFLDYWRRALHTAAAAKVLAAALPDFDADEAFVAALVQDIGMVALWRAYGDRYLQVLDFAEGDHRRVSASERQTFEVDHAMVGAEMARRWRFPDHIADAIEFHHVDERSSTGSDRLLATSACVARCQRDHPRQREVGRRRPRAVPSHGWSVVRPEAA